MVFTNFLVFWVNVTGTGTIAACWSSFYALLININLQLLFVRIFPQLVYKSCVLVLISFWPLAMTTTINTRLFIR